MEDKYSWEGIRLGDSATIFESSFLTNLFGDTNVAHTFYKSSQTYRHVNRGKTYLGTEGVGDESLVHWGPLNISGWLHEFSSVADVSGSCFGGAQTYLMFRLAFPTSRIFVV
jgi:hypothetical protein